MESSDVSSSSLSHRGLRGRENDEEMEFEHWQQPSRTVFAVRDSHYRKAMHESQRLWLHLQHCVESIGCCCFRRFKFKNSNWQSKDSSHKEADDFDGGNEAHVEEIEASQYRVERRRKRKKKSWRAVMLSCATCCFTDLLFQNDADADMGGGTKLCLVRIVHWVYRVSVVPLFAFMSICYYAASVLFAGLIVAAAQSDPSCLRLGAGNVADYGGRFFNAFALSWTTFATTGYGAVYPSLGSQNNETSRCFLMTAICSIEAFLGFIYVGFCAAILFGKVLRIRSHAQVTFSDPILIQYGSGVDEDPFRRHKSLGDDNNNTSKLSSVRPHATKKVPLPVLEFRIVNRLFNENGGEIINANLNVVASIDADDIDPSEDHDARWNQISGRVEKVANSFNSRLRQKSSASSETGSDLSRFFSSSSDHPLSSELSSSSSRRSSFLRPLSSKFIDPFASIRTFNSRDSIHLSWLQGGQKFMEADPTPGQLVGKRIFVKMNMEASSHPIFKRVWLARHVLDDSSPIVKPNVRRQIRRLNGSWPEKLNNHVGVRDSLCFHQVLVSFTGVANISASSVFAQKIYQYDDVSVGYQFVHMMFIDSEGELRVAMKSINDVQEQNGGGGEALDHDNIQKCDDK